MASRKTVTFEDIKGDLLPGIPRQKNVFIDYAKSVAPQTRVGGKTGTGRLTANQALQLLGAK